MATSPGIQLGRRRRLHQGEILRDVDFIEYAVQRHGIIEISVITFPNVVVLTQDCDLQQDYGVRWSRTERPKNHDKKLFSALVAPLYNYDHFLLGEHLSDLGMSMQKVDSKTNKQNLHNNMLPRYHYLGFGKSAPIVPSVVDFKHYFSVNIEHMKRDIRTKFVCRLAPLHREDLSQRFAAFLSRIGLPDPGKPKPDATSPDSGTTA
jgi:hypothetical protein